MPRYVVTPEVALQLVSADVAVAEENELLAPTLIRSQLVSMLYRSVRAGERERSQAFALLDGVRALRLRLLGDRVLQRVAWSIAAEQGWPDTFQAEYVALTKLQADALVTLDPQLRDAVEGVVAVAPIDALRA